MAAEKTRFGQPNMLQLHVADAHSINPMFCVLVMAKPSFFYAEIQHALYFFLSNVIFTIGPGHSCGIFIEIEGSIQCTTSSSFEEIAYN